MGRVLDTNEFGRDGKKGIRVTLVQRSVSEASAENLALAQVAAKFPVKAGSIEILGVTDSEAIIGPLRKYTVDVYVPFSQIGGEPTPSGDISADQIT